MSMHYGKTIFRVNCCPATTVVGENELRVEGQTLWEVKIILFSSSLFCTVLVQQWFMHCWTTKPPFLLSYIWLIDSMQFETVCFMHYNPLFTPLCRWLFNGIIRLCPLDHVNFGLWRQSHWFALFMCCQCNRLLVVYSDKATGQVFVSAISV